MDKLYFFEKIKPLLAKYSIEQKSYKNGDFGDLESIAIEGKNKYVTIEFWSSGWLGIDAINHVLGKNLINIMIPPDKIEKQEEAMNDLLKILLD